MSDGYDLEYQDEVVAAPVPEVSQPAPDANWTLTDLRQGFSRWSLASDNGLLNYLRNFSSNLDQKTKDLVDQVEELGYSAKSTSVRLHNTFNSFIQLSTSQFVENRVYDDDERAATAEVTATAPKVARDFSKEEVEALLVPKYTDAIAAGTHVLDLYISQTTAVDGAHGESMEHNGNDAQQLITSNYWNRRPLPFFIGTAQFAEDDFCGLYYEEPESEEGPMTETVLDGLSEDDIDAEFESLSEDDEPDALADALQAQHGKKRKKRKEAQQGDIYDMSPDHSEDEASGDFSDHEAGDEADENGSEVFDESSEEEEHKVNEELDADDPRAAFARTLNSMLGGGAAPGVAKKSGKKSKKGKKHSDAEGSAPEDENAQSAFADVEDGLDASAAADSQASPAAAPPKKVSFLDEEEDDQERDIFASTAPKSRYASISASLFDDTSAESSKPLFGDDSTAPKPARATASKKSASSNFFDDDDDILGATVAPAPAAKPAKKTSKGGIFDEEEDTDIFAATAPKTTAKATKAADKPKSGFNFADEDDEDFLGAAAAQAAKDAEKKAQKATISAKPTAAPVVAAGPKKSVFDEDEDDLEDAKQTTAKSSTIFDAEANAGGDEEDEPAKAPKPFGGVSVLPKMPTAPGGVKPSDIAKTEKPKKSSMFDEDPMDPPLFGATSNTKKTTSAKSVFADDDDDILSAPIAKPAAKATTTTAPKKTSTVKKSIFDDDGTADDDVFASLAAKAKPAPSAKPTSDDTKPKTTAAAKKSVFDDEDDILGPVKPKATTAKKSVFDDDEDDLLGPVSKAPAKVTATATPAASTEGVSESKSRINAARSFFADGPADAQDTKTDENVLSKSDTKPNSGKLDMAKTDKGDIFGSSEAPAKPVAKVSDTKTSKIASLQQNLNLDVSAMIPGAKRPKASTEDESGDWDPDDDDEPATEDGGSGNAETKPAKAQKSIAIASSSGSTGHTGATSSDVLSESKQLLSDPNLTRAKPQGGRRPPSRRPGSAAASPATASAAPKASAKSIFDDEPAPKVAASKPKETTVSASIFDEAPKPKPAAVVAPVTIEATVAKPVQAAAVEAPKPAKVAASIFDDEPVKPAPAKPAPAAVAASIFDEPKSAPKPATPVAEVAKPKPAANAAASIFDDAPVAKPAAKPAPSAAASIFDEPATTPAKKAEPQTPPTVAAPKAAAASIFDEPAPKPASTTVSASPAPAAASKPAATSASIFDEPIVTKPAVTAPATSAPKTSAASIFDEPEKPAAKPAVSAASIFDEPSPGPAKPAPKPAASVASIFD